MFEPGQQVVCVDDRFHDWVLAIYNELPCAGNIYTIRDVLPGIEADGKTATTAVLLAEIHNEPNASGFERGFAPWRFVELEMDEQEQALCNAFAGVGLN
jgi:hypothetical protein